MPACGAGLGFLCGLQETYHRCTSRRHPVTQERTSRMPRRLGTSLREIAKTCMLGLYVYLWAPVRNLVRSLAGRYHAAVLVYHRVDDEHKDSITVGVDQFNRQLKILKSRYDVLDMPDFLASRGRRRGRVAAVITFDDGYESAHLAARLLRAAGLPACFFVSTRIVGTEAAFPHDMVKLGRCVPALNWDQIRQMSEWGFHFGNHTAHHVNVGAVPHETAIAEIAAGRDDLLRQLGGNSSEGWFAYPYGGRSDISQGVRAALPACGVEYCFSAYGGVNGVDFDPMDIKRQGIDRSFTLLAFRAAVEGWLVRRRPWGGRCT